MYVRSCILIIAVVLAAAPGLAEGPAVESPNGKLAFDAGRVDGDSLQALDASFAFPIGESFGAQLDGAAGLFSGDDFAYAVGGQLFWRDPERALFGIESAYAERSEADVIDRRYGLVSELYLDRFTVAGHGGYSRGDHGDGGYGSLDFTFYAQPDLALRFGGALAPGERGDLLNLAVEYQLAGVSGLTLFADGAAGEDDFTSVEFGVRYYFDTEHRSLVDRQRRQDPRGLSQMLTHLVERDPKPKCPTVKLPEFHLARVAKSGPCAPPPPPVCIECT